MRCRAAALAARAARSVGASRPLCLHAGARRAFSEAREEPFVAVSTVQETSGRFRNEPRERWFWEWRGVFHEHNLKMFECETPAAVAAYYLENCAVLHREFHLYGVARARPQARRVTGTEHKHKGS